MNCSRPTYQTPKNKQIKRKMLHISFWAFTVGFFIGLTPYAFQAAYMERGYHAIGGEAFVPLMPVVLYLLWDSVKPIIDELKGLINHDAMQ